MPVLPPRAVRIGGVTVQPGRTASVRIRMPATPGERSALPALVAVGANPGPRIALLGAPRGFEATAARVIVDLMRSVDPQALSGSLVAVPVLRPGGRFAPRGAPAPPWRLPGDAGGTRAQVNAFAVFADCIVGASVVLVLTAPLPDRRALATARGRFADPRVRRLAREAHMSAGIEGPAGGPTLEAATRTAGTIALELRSGRSGSAAFDASGLMTALRAVLAAVGLLPRAPAQGPPTPLAERVVVVRAPVGGLIEPVGDVGSPVASGEAVARIHAPAGDEVTDVKTASGGLLIEGPGRLGARRGMRLYTVAALPRARRTTAPLPILPPDRPVIGWAERVTLPDLGVRNLKAKIDTGARTSALHVTHMRVVGQTGTSLRREIIEFRIPGLSGRAAAARAVVREHAVVRDTSGRVERRPVIETTVRLGPVERRIRVTLTNRGDMLFPMLVGRTSLGALFIVDPSRRYLSVG